MLDYRKEYRRWCEDSYFDMETRAELAAIALDEEEIKDRFYRELEFGTGGLRGVIGAGTNRMNIYTVRKATQGLANYIISRCAQEKGVAIAFDSRNMSPEFAREAALCLNANGIPTYRFESLRPTPELSFAVRYLGCIAGIVITASHNPREYNGYKVYWEDGAQITPPHDKRILAEAAKITDFSQAKSMEEAAAKTAGLYREIGREVDDAYMLQLKSQSIHPELSRRAAGDIRIVYTPLHGSGNLPVRRVLRELGFEQFFVVEEQELPDGNFPTVEYPNPEDEGAWTLALALAEEKNADIVLATDPDADRLGVYVKDTVSGKYVRFTGNMTGVLIAEYILRERSRMKTMPEKPVIVETIVSTDMIKAVAKDYGIAVREVLTGFKYIGEQIRLLEERKDGNYIFGMEESYGCLIGTYARDKDACVAVMMLCEAVVFYKLQKQTLWDVMRELYERYGYYKEALYTLTLKGADGAQKIRDKMEAMRINTPSHIGGNKVLAVRDYQTGIRMDIITGEAEEMELPVSNVLYYELEDNGWCCVRPSGTEPKIKYYYGVKGRTEEEAEEKIWDLKNMVEKEMFFV